MILGATVVLAYTALGGGLAVPVLLPLQGMVRLGTDAFTAALAAQGPDILTMNAGQTGRAFLFGVMIGGLSWRVRVSSRISTSRSSAGGNAHGAPGCSCCPGGLPPF